MPLSIPATKPKSTMMRELRLSILCAFLAATSAFTLLPTKISSGSFTSRRRCLNQPLKSKASTTTAKSEGDGTFKVIIDLPPSTSDRQAAMKIDSILSVEETELVIVRYKVPFGLAVEPQKGLAVVSADGPNGECVGDVLRYTSQWALGLPSGEGIGQSVGSFAGGLSWQCNMFNVVKAKAWEQVVEALTSNTSERTDEVVLIFERPVGDEIPPELQ